MKQYKQGNYHQKSLAEVVLKQKMVKSMLKNLQQVFLLMTTARQMLTQVEKQKILLIQKFLV
tara:strand:+ start:437 stop:622 length:186 start_codon:yes stop_codon:yes gene_type:complete